MTDHALSTPEAFAKNLLTFNRYNASLSFLTDYSERYGRKAPTKRFAAFFLLRQEGVAVAMQRRCNRLILKQRGVGDFLLKTTVLWFVWANHI